MHPLESLNEMLKECRRVPFHPCASGEIKGGWRIQRVMGLQRTPEVLSTWCQTMSKVSGAKKMSRLSCDCSDGGERVQMVGGSIPALVDVSLSKTLSPELLPVAVSTVYECNLD